MNRRWGFTLIELLVVIAIISILAAIVVPRVQTAVLKARAVKAETEIRSIETALTKALNDANKSRLRDLFADQAPFEPAADYATLWTQVQVQTDLFYQVLRRGRLAEVSYAPGVKEKLGTSYIPDLNLDPWDQKYIIYAGPYEAPDTGSPQDPAAMDPRDIPFRAWRLSLTTPEVDIADPTYVPYVYDVNAKGVEDARIPGNPPADGAQGFPAPVDMSAYILSRGVNLLIDQNFAIGGTGGLRDPTKKFRGGGDDINSWDKTRGWQGFYAG